MHPSESRPKTTLTSLDKNGHLFTVVVDYFVAPVLHQSTFTSQTSNAFLRL